MTETHSNIDTIQVEVDLAVVEVDLAVGVEALPVGEAVADPLVEEAEVHLEVVNSSLHRHRIKLIHI